MAPMRPSEFRIYTDLPLIALFIALVTVLAAFFVKARAQGTLKEPFDREFDAD
jgi:hypothetical protein